MMNQSVTTAIEKFIAQETLPDSYLDTVEQWFMPLAEDLLREISHSQQPLVIGISGCQGSGKSTLANLLVTLLDALMGIRSVSLSLDDFYLTHAERKQLSKTSHPLFATRGVPGTHDVELAINTIQSLKKKGQVAIPRFNKALDDRSDIKNWPVIQGPVDVILLEGWCLNIAEQNAVDLLEPINELERCEDTTGAWRRTVNEEIGRHYNQLYALVDYLIMLKAPSFEKVFEWRQNQEDKLIEKQSKSDNPQSKTMNKTELQRFIQHYERITRHGLLTLPALADTVFHLTDKQTIINRSNKQVQ